MKANTAWEKLMNGGGAASSMMVFFRAAMLFLPAGPYRFHHLQPFFTVPPVILRAILLQAIEFTQSKLVGDFGHNMG